MPRKIHSVQFKYPPRTTLGENLSETEARALAQRESQGNKNRAVEVSANGVTKALFLNGKDVS